MKKAHGTVSIEQPSEYWLTRAGRRQKNGDLRGAAALFRKAARQADPTHESAFRYAEALRDMQCFHSSCREAFDALAADPDNFMLYGLLAENLSHRGMHQAALDAFSLFHLRGREANPDFDAWDYDYAIEETYDERPLRMARINRLLNRASKRLAMGDTSGAGDVLEHAVKIAAFKSNAIMKALSAEVLLRYGDTEAARIGAVNAMQEAKGETGVYAMCADILSRMPDGDSEEYRKALIKTALSVKTDADVILAFETLVKARAYNLLACMLLSQLKQKPDSLTANYNYSVCMLLIGNPKRALRHANICRELDPDDPFTEAWFVKFNDMCLSCMSIADMKKAAIENGAYGAIGYEQVMEMSFNLRNSVNNHIIVFSQTIAADASFRMRYLFVLSFGVLMPLLTDVCRFAPPERREMLCRAALTSNPNPRMREEAYELLTNMGARPPYVTFADGRLIAYDPNDQKQGDASFFNRRIIRVLRKADRYMQLEGFMPLAMLAVHRMDRHKRLKLLKRTDTYWPLALAVVVSKQNDLPGPILEPHQLADDEMIDLVKRHIAELTD